MALTEQNMAGLVSLSEKLREIVNRVGRAATWMLVLWRVGRVVVSAKLKV